MWDDYVFMSIFSFFNFTGNKLVNFVCIYMYIWNIFAWLLWSVHWIDNTTDQYQSVTQKLTLIKVILSKMLVLSLLIQRTQNGNSNTSTEQS